jgi:hypothetical protein
LSETERYTGKIEVYSVDIICFLESEEFQEELPSDYKEEPYEAFYHLEYAVFGNDTYVMIHNENGHRVHKIVENTYYEDDYRAEAYDNKDGTISYDLSFYNGSGNFQECLEDALCKLYKSGGD